MERRAEDLAGSVGNSENGKVLTKMTLLDSIVEANFRSEPAGRVVTFPGDRRHRGYLVRSEAEESKIRSFVKMFLCGQFSILFLGNFLAMEWSRELNKFLGEPLLHPYRAGALAASVYLLVAGLPYLILFRSYKKSFANFVLPQDEVVVSGGTSGRQKYVGALLIAGAAVILLMMGIFFLIQAK